MSKYKKINDVWNAYYYGNKIKVVYIKVASRRIKTENQLTGYQSPKEDNDNLSEERLQASLSRTKSRIFELALCNEFSHFCTFTQDQTKVEDRFDLTTFRKDFAQYVRNQNRTRTEKIKYLLIPERHKTDGAWHLHGLLSGLKVGEDLTEFTLNDHIPYRLREMIENGEKVYNWCKYAGKFGYFTASEIKNKNASASYITKYVTKDMVKQGREAHEHLFFASQGLKGREQIIFNSFDECGELISCPFSDSEWDYENDYVKVKWIDDITKISK